MGRPMDESRRELTFVRANDSDVTCLAELNFQLIQDEGHRNRMSVEELQQRISDWLREDYSGYLFQLNDLLIGYALYRHDPEYVYLRQFFVNEKHRRQGFGKSAMQWLYKNVWQGQRVRVEVLVTNERGVAFWKSIGFKDYCLTLEFEK